MNYLRQDLRAHWLAVLIFLVFWGAIVLFAAAAGLTNFTFVVLLIPPCAVGALIGRSRRTRAAQSSGVIAALIIGVVVLDLSLAGLLLAGRTGEGEPGLTLWQQARLTLFLIGIADLFGLMSSYFGWLYGHEAVYPDEASHPAG